MDYIREELLRQRNAWAALLRSGQRDETETLSEQQAADSRVLEPAKETDRTYRLPAAVAETAKSAPHGAGQARWRNTVKRRGAVSAAEMEAVNWNGTAADGRDPDCAVMPILRPERRQEQGAKELSRIIQRDSRRYDGGFVLY